MSTNQCSSYKISKVFAKFLHRSLRSCWCYAPTTIMPSVVWNRWKRLYDEYYHQAWENNPNHPSNSRMSELLESWESDRRGQNVRNICRCSGSNARWIAWIKNAKPLMRRIKWREGQISNREKIERHSKSPISQKWLMKSPKVSSANKLVGTLTSNPNLFEKTKTQRKSTDNESHIDIWRHIPENTSIPVKSRRIRSQTSDLPCLLMFDLQIRFNAGKRKELGWFVQPQEVHNVIKKARRYAVRCHETQQEILAFRSFPCRISQQYLKLISWPYWGRLSATLKSFEICFEWPWPGFASLSAMYTDIMTFFDEMLCCFQQVPGRVEPLIHRISVSQHQSANDCFGTGLYLRLFTRSCSRRFSNGIDIAPVHEGFG